MSGHEPAPEHDPLSEEMDLITFQEAEARLHEELARLRAEIESLKTTGRNADSDALRARLGALEAVAERLRRQRTQPRLSVK